MKFSSATILVILILSLIILVVSKFSLKFSFELKLVLISPLSISILKSFFLSNFSDTDIVKVQIEVINSKDGTPVEKASVSLSGLNVVSVNITDSAGNTFLNFNSDDFIMDTNEGYLKPNFENSYFLKKSLTISSFFKIAFDIHHF